MIHYFSQTGNTKLLGDFLKNNINDSKTIYVGFWTDKGNANQETLDYLKTLHHQKIFLFGTAGFGKSEEPKKEFYLIDYVNILNKLFEQLNINNPILIGHSFGGKISILYASKYKVKKLVLLASPFKQEKKDNNKNCIFAFFVLIIAIMQFDINY